MTALVLHDGGLNDERVALIKRTICKGATDDELTMFVETARRLQLDPFARQVFAVKRWDSKERREVMAIQVSIDGFRLVAERTGKYAGQLGPLWTADGKVWREVWLDKVPPAAAKVAVLRSDFKEPLWAVATWEQYKQTKQDGSLTAMWSRMGALMLGKCAESLALRRAFPNELSGVYTQEEMAQATTVDVEAEAAPANGETPTTGRAQPAASTHGTPGLPHADKVIHDGELLTAAQLQKLQILRREAGGTYCGDDGDDKSLWRMKVLGAYRTQAGERITSSKQLSKKQASHLIERLTRHIAKTQARAAETPDIGAAFSAPAPAPDMTELAAQMADKGIPEDDLCGFFGKDSITSLDRAEAGHALALVLAWDTDRWPEVRDSVRDAIEARQ